MDRLLRATAATRYLWALAALAVMFGAFVLLLAAVGDVIGAVVSTIVGAGDAGELRIVMIEAVDTILVSTVMYVISIGLVQLFVTQDLRQRLPLWLRVSDVAALESRLTGMVVTVISVIALSRILEWHGGWEILALGITVAAIIAAISLFLRGEHPGESVDELREELLVSHRTVSATDESAQS